MSYDPEDIKIRFIKFIKKFKLTDGTRPYCPDRLYMRLIKKNVVLNISLTHIAQFDSFLYLKIIGFPSELASFFDYIINNFFCENILLNQLQKQNKIKINFWLQKFDHFFDTNDVSPEIFNKIQSISGRIVKLTKNFFELSSILFKCEICDFETYSIGEIGDIQEPIYCFLCKNFNSFQIIYSRCYFNKIKFLKIQNHSSNYMLKKDHTTLLVVLRNHFSKIFSIGDTIKTTGILRINSYFDKLRKTESIFFGVYLDSFSIYKTNSILLEDYQCKKTGIKHNLKIFSSEYDENKILLKSISENLNFYYIFQDSCFTEQIGIEPLKKTIGSLYCNCKFKKKSSSKIESCYLNLLIKDKNTEPNFLQFKDILSMLRNFIYIDGKLENDKQLIFSIDSQDGLSGNKFIKGKLLKADNKLCCIDNLDVVSDDFVAYLKEILTRKKISIIKSSLNYCLEAKTSFLATIRGDEHLNKKEFFSKKIRKNCGPVVPIFDLFYILKISNLNFYENYMLKSLPHMLVYKLKKKKPEWYGLENVGLKLKGGIRFLEIKRKSINSFLPFFSLVEIIKLGNLTSFLVKLKTKQQNEYFFDFLKKIEAIACKLAKMRLSNLVATEDVRLAFLTLTESLKSINISDLI